MIPLVLFFSGCSVFDGNAGEVHIMSQGKMYDVVSNRIFKGHGEKVKNINDKKDIKEFSAEIESEIPYSEDFAIYVQGNHTDHVLYSLYDEEFTELYSGRKECETPLTEGKYYCLMEITWGDEDSFVGYQYCFSFNIYT